MYNFLNETGGRVSDTRLSTNVWIQEGRPHVFTRSGSTRVGCLLVTVWLNTAYGGLVVTTGDCHDYLVSSRSSEQVLLASLPTDWTGLEHDIELVILDKEYHGSSDYFYLSPTVV